MTAKRLKDYVTNRDKYKSTFYTTFYGSFKDLSFFESIAVVKIQVFFILKHSIVYQFKAAMCLTNCENVVLLAFAVF